MSAGLELWGSSELSEGAAPQRSSWLVSQGIQVTHELLEPSGRGG